MGTLSEKIYISRSIDTLDGELDLFFKELEARRRDDPVEEGLQSGGIISKKGFAVKVCENDGVGSHRNAFVNSLKALNGDSNYVSEEDTSKLALIANDIKEITGETIQLRLIAKQDELVIIAISHANNINSEQLQMLSCIINTVKKLKGNNFKRIKVGICVGDLIIEPEELKEEIIGQINKNTSL